MSINTNALSSQLFAKISEELNKITSEMPAKSIKDANDGVIVDICHHKVLFEDKVLRVLDVTVKGNKKEPFHTHELPAVMYMYKPAAIEYYGNAAKPDEHSPTIPNEEPGIFFIPSEKMHAVKNVDTKGREFGALRFEIKKALNSVEEISCDCGICNALRESKVVVEQKALKAVISQSLPKF